MAETLGSLSDKLTIVKLKQFHTDDTARLESLSIQEVQLQNEIDEFIAAAVAGRIAPERLTFAANKVFKEEGNETADVTGSLGQTFSQIADVNCRLWHAQEKVYEFETIPAEDKDRFVKKLAVLNLERNKCIDHIDQSFLAIVRSI